MDQPLISIIVPVYKVEKYIEQCLDSISKQTYKNLEIILIDDGSPDASGELCDQYSKKDSRIKVIHQKNKGLSGARNTGLDIAHGEYISFVDSDDYLELDFIDKLYQALIVNDSDISICGFINEYPKHKILSPSLHKTYSQKDAVQALIEDEYINNYAWNKLYKKKLFDENLRFPEGEIYEDIRIMYKVFMRCEKIVTIQDHLYHYIIRTNSITGNAKGLYELLNACKVQQKDVLKVYPEFKSLLLLQEIVCYRNLYTETNVKETKKQCMIKSKKLWNEIREKHNIKLKKRMKVYVYLYTPTIFSYLKRKKMTLMIQN